MKKDELTKIEDTLISMVEQSTRLLKECKAALYDYDGEGVICVDYIVDRFSLMSQHVERLKPYYMKDEED